MRERGLLVMSLGLLVAGWLIARWLLEIDPRFSDVPLYRDYGELLVAGEIAYRDVPIEYPPGALPLFALPAALSETLGGFRLAFELVLLACAAATVAAVDIGLRHVGASFEHRVAMLSFVVLAPLLLGRVSFERYDLWPATLATLGIVLATLGRFRLSAVALGFGAAAKLFPLALVPILIAVAWRRSRREALVASGLAVGVALACFAPFLALAPDETLAMLTRQLERPLQIESVAATPLLLAHAVGGLSIGIESSYGSINLGGRMGEAAAAATSLAGLALLALLYILAVRRRPPFVLAAAAIAVVVVTGKVLSPQFLLWLVPLVALVPRRTGLVAAGLLAAAALVTQAVFPDRYLALIRTEAEPIWLLAARNALLVAILVVVGLAALRDSRGDARSAGDGR